MDHGLVQVRLVSMSVLFAAGSPTTEMSAAEVKAGLFSALEKLGERKKVLAVPPDFTRFHSKAGCRGMTWLLPTDRQPC